MLNIMKNLPLKIISLILAISFWMIIITSQQTPFQFAEELDIKAFNLSERLSIVTPLPKVKIKIVTNKENLAKLTKQNFEAYIDLRNIKDGKHVLNVSVAPKTPNVTVASISPSQVTVDIENIAQKPVPIAVSAKGSPADGYKIEKLEPHANRAQIKGAESLVKKISEVKAIAYLEGTEDLNFQKEIILQAFDSAGAEIKEISIEPRTIKMDVGISQTIQQKSIAIKANISSAPKNGSIEKITVEPPEIEVKGDKKSLEGIEYIETMPIDAADFAAGSIEKNIQLNMPKGVSLADESKNRIKVTIEIKLN